MSLATAPVAQSGILPDLVGIAGTLVLVLILVALGAFVYRSLTGGVDWPDEPDEDDESLQRGDRDDEWDYY